jgi:hypothetical protein
MFRVINPCAGAIPPGAGRARESQEGPMIPALFVLLPILFVDLVVVAMAWSIAHDHRVARRAKPHA